jgi:hypothetical protein
VHLGVHVWTPGQSARGRAPSAPAFRFSRN